MPISQLRITHFRNIDNAELNLGRHLNLIAGANASGKSSLIEAIYFLSRARSFRTHVLRSVIKQGESSATVFAHMTEEDPCHRLAIGIEKGKCSAQLDGQAVARLSELTMALPVQLLTPRSYELLISGPRMRRRLLHWGLFHTRPEFLPLYRRYMTSLSQRNAALRQHLAPAEFIVWDRQLSETAQQIVQHSQHYVEGLQGHLNDRILQLLPGHEVHLEYRAGWNTEQSLADALQKELQKDLEIGYTRIGPHRADLKLFLDGQLPERYASNGQQKLLIFAMLMAQGLYYQQLCDHYPLMLMDDFASELDEKNQENVMNAVMQHGIQCISTRLSSFRSGSTDAVKRFHVEQGMFHVEP